MNPYFSRLAQRSSVATTVAGSPSGNSSSNAVPNWSEQSVEKTAPVSALISDNESGTSASAIENKSIQTGNLNFPTSTTQPINAPSKPISVQQHEQISGSLNTSAKSSLVSNTLTTGSNFIEYNSSLDSFNTETSVSLSIPDEQGSKSESLATRAKYSSIFFDSPSSGKPSLPEFIEDSVHTIAATRTTAETTEPASDKAHNIKTTQPDSEPGIKSTAQHAVHNQVAAQAIAVQSRHVDSSIEQVKSTASAPGQTPGLSVQTPRAAPRVSTQVHIGKIELEIFSPTTTKPAAAPALVQTTAPRASRTAAFNPHRHYLRSR